MDSGFQFQGKLLFTGQDLLPPAHPRCACAVEYIETETSKFESNLPDVETGYTNHGNQLMATNLKEMIIMMTANREFMYWRTNKQWYRINEKKDCFELTDQAPSRAKKKF